MIFQIGPAVGAYLYEIGGFLLPFEVVGIAEFIFGILVIIFLPTLSMQDDASEIFSSNDGNIFLWAY